MLGLGYLTLFGGFSAEALKERLQDAEAKTVITADGGWRQDAIIPLKPQVDLALAEGVPSVEKVLVVQQTGQTVEMTPDRDIWLPLGKPSYLSTT